MQSGYRLSLNTEQEISVATRAELLAARIEEGAARLADFAEALSEKEWRTPVGTHGRDKRPIGVIVHHVASVYPIEVDLAKVTAQFVVEDHALRHSWHHLARIKAAVGK